MRMMVRSLARRCGQRRWKVVSGPSKLQQIIPSFMTASSLDAPTSGDGNVAKL